MLNLSLVRFDQVVKYIGIIFILLIILSFIFLIINRVLDNIFKEIINLEKVSLILKKLICIIYLILTFFTIYLYIKYNFSLELANYCNNLMETYLNTTGKYKIVYTMKTENYSSEPIEYVQDILGTIVKIALNYYRTAYILLIAPFPIVFKGFLGIIFSVIVRKLSSDIVNLFGTKNQLFDINGYTFENLFYLYNLSIYLMLVTIIFIPLLLKLESFLNKSIDRSNLKFVELPRKKISLIYIKQVLINLKMCLVYFKLDILVIVIKTFIIFGVFIYFNSLLFILLHSLPGNLIKLLNNI